MKKSDSDQKSTKGKRKHRLYISPRWDQWALIVNLDTLRKHVKMTRWKELTSDNVNTVIHALIFQLHDVAYGYLDKKGVLNMVEHTYDSVEEDVKRFRQKENS